MKKPLISIVVSVYNRQALLNRTIDSINESKYKNWEIVIIDDASDEPVICNDPKARIIRLEKNTKVYFNPCIPYNVGFKASKGDIIIIQNPECYHNGDVLTYVAENIKENDYLSIAAYNADLGEDSVDYIVANTKPDKWYNHPYHRPINFHFCCAITRKDLIEKMDYGFDPRYQDGMGFDDTEFIRRIYRKGFNVVQSECPFVVHQWHDRNYQNRPELFDKNSKLYHNEYLPGEQERLTERTRPKARSIKKMRLGASYNVFDGTELLRESILSIRENVDHISVVYQEISNKGNETTENLLDLMMDLLSEGLINDVLYFMPDLKLPAAQNELNKRNIGYINSFEAGCTHHISMDCDEFYDKDQFREAKNYVRDHDLDSSACSMMTYYKNNYTILWPIEPYYVPFIYKIRPVFMYSFINWPVLVDPTRRIVPGNTYVFNQSWIMMHHFSYVRKDLKVKLSNSSANVDWMAEKQNKMVEHFNNWKQGDKILCMSGDFADSKEVEPKFLLSWDFSQK